MSFLKLAVPLAALLLVPAAHAQVDPPQQVGSPTIFVGTPLGLVKDDNLMVIPYKGNVTVPVAVTLPCSLVLFGPAAAPTDSGHIHVELADPPAWALGDEVELGPVSPADCAGAEASHTYTGSFSLAVAASAPGIVPQTLNFTAHYAGVPSDTKGLSVSIQFRADYDVVPSIGFPHTVEGGQANFIVTVTSRGNARNMVMVEEVNASPGTFSGLGSLVYENSTPRAFQVSYKAPEGCWTSATVEFRTYSHYLLLNQQAGSVRDERHHVWEFVNGTPCEDGNGTQTSPLGGWALIAALLGAALLARRRL